MAKRRTQVELAAEAKARLEKEQANFKREHIRLRRDNLKQRRRMLSVSRAAEQNRFTNDWIAPSTSADSEIISDLIRVNARARQLVRDDPWAKSIVKAFCRNVVGTGITPNIDGQPFQRDWEKFSRKPKLIDIEKKRNLLMIEKWAMSELVTVGEAFVVRWIIKGRLVLQCYEFEQLDQYKIQEPLTGNEVRHGIEVDENGAAVAYHFYRNHPHDIRGMARPAPMALESIRIDAEMVCHVFDPDRARQTHGISWLRPIIRSLRDMTEYDAAQLRTARAEASIGLIIHGGDDDTDPLMLDGLGVAYVGEDESVTPFVPQRPGGGYDPFVKTQGKRNAAGVGLSYDQVARDNSEGSFSSSRMGAIESRREFGVNQELLKTQLCEPIMEDFQFVWAMQNPEQSGNYFLLDDMDEIPWQGQGFDWVDPEAQGKAIERKLRLGLTTRTIEANELGRTVKQLDKQAKEDGTIELVNRLNGDGRESPAPDQPQPVVQPAEKTLFDEVAANA